MHAKYTRQTVMYIFLSVAVAACIFSPRIRAASSDAGFATYANIWAVEVDGGKEAADALAIKYHLVNKGQVSFVTCKLEQGRHPIYIYTVQ